MAIFKYTLLALLLLLVARLDATHNRAGEITYQQIGDLTIRMTVTTYTKTSSISVDRDSVEVVWGDGTREWVRRSNGNGQPLPNDIKFNIYVAEHTYPGLSTYTISMTDPNRNGGIVNLNAPNSENILFHLETTFTFLNPQFQGYNSSPVLLQPPVDIGCVGQLFIHNPNAFDPDGDSLAYELIVPLQERNLEVPNYVFPQGIGAGPDNMVTLDEATGDFIWRSPQQAGEYSIAILIKEYRQGLLINTLIRDMQILIRDECDNRPPEIETIDEICVIAGERIEFDVIVTDPDRNPPQRVSLSATGGPLIQEISPAVLEVADGFQEQPLVGRFVWQTDCDHISDAYYVVIFRAEDNAFGGVNGLSTLRSVRIKVVGPPPENLEAETQEESVTLTWDLPYACDMAANDYFRGFAIWRRNSSNPFEQDSCSPTMEGTGYTRIAFNHKESEGMQYVYTDTDVEKGKTYCYRIVGEFARVSLAGNPFNLVESIPSNEVCVQLSRDVPIITRVSVLETDQNQGVIEVKWSKPLEPDFDVTEYPGPYRYQVYRSIGINTSDFVPIPDAVFTANDFSTFNDSMYIDSNLNTVQNPYTYRVDFLTGPSFERYGGTNPASSVFLGVVSTDRRNILSWDFSVPWENLTYEIYRRDEGQVDFELINAVEEETYTDRKLENGREYCYFVKAIGTYGITMIEDPLLNNSQELCGIPLDTVAPCPPVLVVMNDCELTANTPGNVELFNQLTWNNPIDLCGEDSEDVTGYKIYYAPPPGTDFVLIAEINNPSDLDFEHNSEFGVAGCYAITSIDRIGNESEFSSVECVDNCPLYRLPNTFTPNGDGFNDIFRPSTNRYISQVEFKVFSVWGTLVYESGDPELNWDGKDQGGNDLAEGTYYYTCRVFESRIEGPLEQSNLLSGYIELIR